MKTTNLQQDPNGILKLALIPLIRPSKFAQLDDFVLIKLGGRDCLQAKVLSKGEFPNLGEVPPMLFSLVSGHEDGEAAKAVYQKYYTHQGQRDIPFAFYLLKRQ